jgi:hypothetical protein
MPHRPGLVIALVFASLLFGPSAGFAQALTPDRVQRALEETDRRIELAQTLLAESDNPAARAELGVAIDLQARARTAFASSQLAMASRLTFEARTHADRVIALVRGLPDPDRVRAQLERTREMLERARSRIEGCSIERARALLHVAFEMQLRAEASAQAGRHLAALQLTMSARERGLRALRLCRLDENASEGAERALHRTDEVIARARDAVSEHGDEQARRALDRARDLQEDAMRESRAEHFESSLRLTTAARGFAHRAIRLARRSG